MSSLEDFLSSAVLADKDFVAEKVNVSFVDSSAGAKAAAAGASKGKANGPLTSGTVRTLRIPRRPKWTGSTTADELHRAEKESFLAWRREVAALEIAYGGGVSGPQAGVEEAAVTPFEKNLEVWRQLWRVVERCDVLVQIVDARNPLMYRCPDLEAYAHEVNPLKKCLLLVNKADYLTPLQRLSWARYFTANGISFVFFSAAREQQRLEELDRMQAAAAAAGTSGLDALEEEEDEDEEDDGSSYVGSDAGASSHDDDADGGASASKTDANKPAAGAASAAAGGKKKAPLTAGDAVRAAARDKALNAALRKALILDDDEEEEQDSVEPPAGDDAEKAAVDDSTSDSDSDSVSDDVEAIAVKANAAAATATSAYAAAPLPPSAADINNVTAASDSNGGTSSDAVVGGLPVPASSIAFSDPSAEDMAGIDKADPLYDACRVLTREELTDVFQTLYGSLPRPPLGTGDEAARQRRAEALARQKEADKAARAEELKRRRDMAQRMIEVGLGASLRYGGLADAAGLGEEDEEEEQAAEQDSDVSESGTGDAGGAASGYGEEEHEDRPLQIGFVGYPNVGKSSTINALLGATAANHASVRVAVGATPGKTKHFQSLVLTDDITLCDCPGLVFPSFVATREELVVSGVLPIDNMRDYVSPIRLLCQRVHRSTFEAQYGLKLPLGDGQGTSSARAGLMTSVAAGARQPTPYELLDAFACMRGFSGQTHSGWDRPRAARILLKDYCQGKLVFCHPPPEGGWGRWLMAQAAAGAGASYSASSSSAAAAAEPLDLDESSATAAASSGGKASDIINVLKPAAANKYSLTSQQATTSDLTPAQQAALQRLQTAAASSSAAVAAAAASSVPVSTRSSAAAPARDNDEEEDEEEADAADLDGLDEATLRQFGRVIIGSAVAPAEEDDEEEEEEGEEGEGGASESAGGGAVSVTTGPGGVTVIRTDAALHVRPKSNRAQRVPGLGRYGKLKKGSRPADPYGTSAAADAANRRFDEDERAAVAAGPAVAGRSDFQVLDDLQQRALAQAASSSASSSSVSGRSSVFAGGAVKVGSSSSVASVVSGISASTVASKAVTSARPSSVIGSGGSVTGSSGGRGGSTASGHGVAKSKGTVKASAGAAYREIVPAHLRGQIASSVAVGGSKK